MSKGRGGPCPCRLWPGNGENMSSKHLPLCQCVKSHALAFARRHSDDFFTDMRHAQESSENLTGFLVRLLVYWLYILY